MELYHGFVALEDHAYVTLCGTNTRMHTQTLVLGVGEARCCSCCLPGAGQGALRSPAPREESGSSAGGPPRYRLA